MYKQASKFRGRHGELQPTPKRVRPYHPDNEKGHATYRATSYVNPSRHVVAIFKEFRAVPRGCKAHNGGILTPSKPMIVRQVRVIHGFHGDKVVYIGE